MPQTRSSRIPDPIGVEGTDGSTQASDANPLPTSTVVAGAPVDPRAVRALLSGTDSVTIVPSGTQAVSDASRSGALQAGVETPVSVTAVLIHTANADDKEVAVQNTGAGIIRIGPAGVTATTGFRLSPGGHKVYSDPVTTNDLYAIRDGAADSIALVQAVR